MEKEVYFYRLPIFIKPKPNKMIYKVERMATSKKYASEDASFFMEKDDVIVAGVFDGCGGALESHFASNLYMRVLRNCLENMVNSLDIITRELFVKLIELMCLGIKAIALSIDMTYLQLQSTIVFAVYNKKTKVLKCSILGDGFIHYKQLGKWHHIDIHMPGNAPDYLGYYIFEDEEKLKENLNSRVFYTIENVEEYSIGSDGIDSIKMSGEFVNYLEMHKLSLIEYYLEWHQLKQSEAKLERHTNVLLAKKAELGDDLTIIRYIPDENTNTIQTAQDSNKDSSAELQS